jgi:hypothetical protein
VSAAVKRTRIADCTCAACESERAKAILDEAVNDGLQERLFSLEIPGLLAIRLSRSPKRLIRALSEECSHGTHYRYEHTSVTGEIEQ